jgi:serine-type D-Ala-D-Ala carboxypeptidase (penicillin-binding protein 5/6)
MRSTVHWIGIGLCLAALSWPATAALRAAAGSSTASAARPAARLPHEFGPPGPPSTLLMEVSTGQVLESADPHRRLPPASLDKLMTFYLALEAIKAHRLTLETEVTVSEVVWRVGRTAGSSRMFLNVGDTVTIEQLLRGLMVASGNDAAEALAEALAGSGPQFVHEMNAAAARLGMRDTHFVSAHGLPNPGEYTSAWDMGVLARQILSSFPEATTYTSPRYETYAGIRQANWNNLVFRDPRVDGLKTGFTNESGFHIVATARQGMLRIVAVVMGAHKLQERTGVAEQLLNLGFARYVLVTVPWQQIVPSAVPVYAGSAGLLTLETPHAVEVLLPRDQRAPLTISEEVRVPPVAPFRKGQSVGTLTISTPTAVLATSQLVASSNVDRARMFARLWGMLRYKVGSVLHHRKTVWTGTFSPPS